MKQIDCDIEDAVPGHLAAADPDRHRQRPGHGGQEAVAVESPHDPGRTVREPRRGGTAAGVAERPALDGEILELIPLAQGLERESACGDSRRSHHDHRRPSSFDTAGRTDGSREGAPPFCHE